MSRLANTPGQMTAACLLVLLLVPIVIYWRGAETRDALATYERAAAGAPVAVYRVADKREETTGVGKSRKTTYDVDLAWVEGDAGAPRGTSVRVGPTAFETATTGSRWTGRVVGGRVLFDPRVTRVELDREQHTRTVMIVIGVIAALVLVATRKGWLHRPL